MAARTTFPKKDGRICALVPQKARAWGVTSLEINTNCVVEGRYCTFLACKIHLLRLDENGWLHIVSAHYDQYQKEPFLIMKKVLINCKLIKKVYAKQLTRNYHVSINLILGLPLNGNTEQIGNADK